MTVRLLLCSHAAITRSALHQLLAGVDDIEVVAESGAGEDVVAAVRSAHPDVVLMEAAPEQIDYVGTVMALVRRDLDPPAAVIVLCERAPLEAAVGLFRAGVRGFLLTNDRVDDLLYGVRTVAGGGAVITPSMLFEVIDRLSAVQPVDGIEELSVLTPRELEVLHLLTDGMSNAEIAESLRVEETTVKSHVSRMLGKLGLRNRVQAVALVHRSGAAVRGDPGAGLQDNSA